MSLARLSISLKVLTRGLVEGLNAASCTDNTPLLESPSKSKAPPVPLTPVRKPANPASFPKKVGLISVKAVCVSPAWQPEHVPNEKVYLVKSSLINVEVLLEPVPSQ